jgi:hypothetical protein
VDSVATVPGVTDLILDQFKRYPFSTGMGLPEPTQDLLCQLIKSARCLACHDPAIGLTLDLALPQLAILGHVVT